MTKRLLSAAILASALFFSFAPYSRATDIRSTIGPFDEAPDFSGNYPLTVQNLGTLSFSIPANFTIASITISGTFGNEDVPGQTDVTADSDYFVDGTVIKVASCDSPNVATAGLSLACDGGNNPTDTPTAWSYTFTKAQIATLASALAAGSLDFNVIQNYYGAVETGPITLDIASTPEPATFSFIALGLAAFALRRRRKLPKGNQTMNIALLTIGVCATLFVASPSNAQQIAKWTNATPGGTPTIPTISGGPWNLSQGGPYSPASNTGATTSGGPVSGTTPYCSAGVPIVNSPSTANPMQPFYVPQVTGRGSLLQGYFDYRPRNVNEAAVAATSSDGGNTWNFEQQIENLTTACPTTDTNSSGNDDGLGHPSVLSFGGAGFIYLLDRRNGHVDFDGLVVHTLTPKAGAPFNGLPASIEVGNIPPTSETIARWDFKNYASGTLTNSPLPSIGTGTATSLGMTNNYSYVTGSHTYTGSVTADDLTSTTGGTDPSASALAWRIRGTSGDNGPNTGNGWSISAPQYTQGVQFMVSTVGYYNIVFQYDWYTTAQGVRNLQARYTTDGSAWTNVGPIQVAQSGGGYSNQISINFPALGITGVNNNPNFGVQLVSVYDPIYTGTGAPTYTAATLGTNGPVQINNTSGNWRFDEINVLGTSSVTTQVPTAPETSGLTNPDGILAQVPNVFPLKILYVDKTLNGDFAFPASQQCGLSSSGGAPNHDTSYIRIATSVDGVHWTDQGPVTGLNDPTTVSLHAVRYVAPNGSLVKLPNGNWGLFFGGGNCLDGDSDAFHAIMYAESTNLTSWTVYNGIDNPIASVANTTDPSTGATIPATAPVLGATQLWFTGRVYNPQATWASGNTVNLTFAGYDSAYSADISSYRTIGHAVLSTSTTTLP